MSILDEDVGWPYLLWHWHCNFSCEIKLDLHKFILLAIGRSSSSLPSRWIEMDLRLEAATANRKVWVKLACFGIWPGPMWRIQILDFFYKRDRLFGGGEAGADFLWRGRESGGFLEWSYYRSRSDCTRPRTMIGWVREGRPSRLGGRGYYIRWCVLIFECSYVHFRVQKRHLFELERRIKKR